MRDLEILIPTYGRAESLRRTLEALAASPFASSSVTVVDNASPDATPEVCAELAPSFRELRHVRNPRNVGAPANVLRSIEHSRGTYTWVIADDDEWNLAEAADVVAVIAAGAADIVSVGGPGREGWPAGHTTMGALVAGGAPVHYVFTFLPNTIFRTELFDERALRRGYELVGTLYPTMSWIHDQVERDAPVYVSERPLVARGGQSVPGSELEWFTSWARACAIVRDPALRRRELFRPLPGPAWVLWIGAIVLEERLTDPARARATVRELLRLLPRRQRVLALPGAALLLVPRGPAAALRALTRRLTRR